MPSTNSHISSDRRYITLATASGSTYELENRGLLAHHATLSSDSATTLAAERRTRTPSPTPSEDVELTYLNGTVTKSFWQKTRDRLGLHWKYLVRWIIILVLIALTILYNVYEEPIVKAIHPLARKLLSISAGWLIPIVIMIALSFPPLFGQEIVIIIVGVIWGLGPGFGIAAAGTILGEFCTYYVFRYFCVSWSRKQREKSISFACLTRVIRDGGAWIPIVVRYSALPDHFSTAVFATCGMPLWVFCVSVMAALPNQVALVYWGVSMEATIMGNASVAHTENIVNDVLIAVSVVSTIVAQHYLHTKMQAVKADVIYQRRKERQAKMLLLEKETNDRPEGVSEDVQQPMLVSTESFSELPISSNV